MYRQGDGANQDNTLQSVKCQECGDEIALVHPEEIKKELASGRYVRGSRVVKQKQWGDGTTYSATDGIWGICKTCAREAPAALDFRGAEAATNAQHRRIMDRVAYLRERADALSLEEVIHAAVEQEFDPLNEPNREFRRYLLERGTPENKPDSFWAPLKKRWRSLWGPHADGAA